MPETLPRPPALAHERSCWLPRHRRSAGLARRLLRTFLADGRASQPCVEVAELVLSELVTNAVVHARVSPGRLILVRLALSAAVLRIEVHDAGTERPLPRAADPDDETGRGLWLVDQLSAAWGCRPRPDGIGKFTWAQIEVAP